MNPVVRNVYMVILDRRNRNIDSQVLAFIMMCRSMGFINQTLELFEKYKTRRGPI